MEKNKDHYNEPDWPRKRLEELKQQLDEGSKLSDTKIDELLQHLSTGAKGVDTSLERWGEMLSIIVSDALNGVDISSEYPEFFQACLVNRELRELFLHALETLEDERAGVEISLPGPLDEDISFIENYRSPSEAPPAKVNHWPISWERTRDELQNVIAPATASRYAERSLQSFLDDMWFMLMRAEAEVEGANYQIALEATQPNESPNELRLALQVARDNDPRQPRQEIPPLLARVEWGPYAAERKVSPEGQASFPAIPLAQNMDEDDTILHNLQFTLTLA